MSKINQRKRAVLYARVSGDDRKNEGRNLLSQLEMCREYATSHQWQIVAELAEDDRGASGASFELPKLNQLLDMAQAGAFDVLVVREVDRLSRQLAKQLIVEAELKRNKVQIEYVLGDYPETPEGNLMKHVRATIAEYEREKISERMTRGRRQKVKAGYVVPGGRTAYGYRSIQKDDGNFYLEVYKPEARIVRMIYEWYANGDEQGNPLSIRAITRKLTELHVPTFADMHPEKTYRKREGKNWNPNSVRKILTNKIYIGIWEYGERDSDNILSVEVPAIVDKKIWKAAQSRRAKNKKMAKRNRKHNYLLSGHVRCFECGGSVSGQTFYPSGKCYQYYVCLKRRSPLDHSQRCSMPNFRVEEVDRTVWSWISDLLEKPQKIKKGYDVYLSDQQKFRGPIIKKLEIVDGMISENEAELERLLELYLKGNFPEKYLVEHKNRLQETIESLVAEKEKCTQELDVHILTMEEIQNMQDVMAYIAEGLFAAEEDYLLRRQILDTLDLEVRLAMEEGKKVIHIRCILTNKSFEIVPTAICGSCRYKNRLQFQLNLMESGQGRVPHLPG